MMIKVVGQNGRENQWTFNKLLKIWQLVRSNSLQNDGGDRDQHDAEHDLSAMIVLLVEGLTSSAAMPRASTATEKETGAGKNSRQEKSDQGEAGQPSVMGHYNFPFLKGIRECWWTVDQSDHTCDTRRDDNPR